MNPQDPLAALNPLREPDLIGWWPLAPGWWIVSAVILLLLALGIYHAYRHYKRNAYRRAALRKLQIIGEQYLSDGRSDACLAAINALLKSAALVAYSRRQIASVSGEQWLEVINRELPPEHHLPPGYLTTLYGNSDDGEGIEQVMHAARLWIRRHRSASQ